MRAGSSPAAAGSNHEEVVALVNERLDQAIGKFCSSCVYHSLFSWMESSTVKGEEGETLLSRIWTLHRYEILFVFFWTWVIWSILPKIWRLLPEMKSAKEKKE